MNTMEDNELEVLFEAKRTVEANRRRQEKLRQMLEADGGAEPVGRKERPLWPVWAGAAAAAVALLLITLPALFGSRDSVPTVVAATEVPATAIAGEEPAAPEAPRPTPRPKAATPKQTAAICRETGETRESGEAGDTIVPVVPVAVPAAEEPAEEAIPETAAPAKRVFHRQSTVLVCTEGCKAPEGNSETKSREVQVNFFNNDNYAEAAIYSISINK